MRQVPWVQSQGVVLCPKANDEEQPVPHYQVVQDLLKEVEIPPNGTLSRTLYRDDNVKIVLFGFAGGQELSQHTDRKSVV